MSLYSTITELLKDKLEKFISIVAEKYSIPENELSELFFADDNNKSSPNSKPKPKKKEEATSINTTDLSPQRLNNSTKLELVGLCKVHKHKTTGTKKELIERLLGKSNSTIPAVIDKKSSKTKSSKETVETTEENTEETVEEKTTIVIEEDEEETEVKVKPKSFSKKNGKNTEIIKKVESTAFNIQLRTNSFDNIVHPPTELVFNNQQVVIGKQNDDGSISDLTTEDIETCKKYKFKYIVPDNLDTADNFHNKKISDVDPLDILLEKKQKEESEDEVEEDEDNLEEEDLEDGAELSS